MLPAQAGSSQDGARHGLRPARHGALACSHPTFLWYGPVYYPYAYNDMFYYTFWPDAYDPGYWAYAYDDMFDGVFFPDGAPYAAYAAEGPYAGPDGRITTGSAPSRPAAAPGRVTQAIGPFMAAVQGPGRSGVRSMAQLHHERGQRDHRPATNSRYA